ncbi:threonine-phosphate decarboxylase [Actinobacteria bacterium YIM 96077]|uniref:Aminotransferase n=1 Tax=Phytoactinopolyspora halophila TaxID=1981511 RepID=A0A329QPD8_9ACTN|nr:Rv2231c family pyridoxal phosphate-dependent protein CobC [Phytoactinopolyspora halophila]AYY15064.1 threonine-phosphate decarboxylase [Actinobacteria bacterium YIM 96077]RAW14224.1 threonine-phosphate decarboxylase [Phytoactinopolyspora halophila]
MNTSQAHRATSVHDQRVGEDGGVDLRHHGDAEVAPGMVDLAVNVRTGMPPGWLRQRLASAIDGIATYPDARPAADAIAGRHGRSVDDVLPTAGGAEAFTLLARALRPGVDVRRPVVVHPQFTEPEAALGAAGHGVERVILSADDGFRLRPEHVPGDADLVVVGNPTNPTSVLHPADVLTGLARPGRILVVDEAFMDAVPAEPESLAGRPDIPGLVVLRSLTKTWGLAGLRAGYVAGPEPIIRALRQVQPPWSVSSLAVEAIQACVEPAAVAEAERLARADAPVRERLTSELRRLGGQVVPHPRAPFVLVRFDDGDRLRQLLRDLGWALRRGDTFPGLGPEWMRIALRDEPTMNRFVARLGAVLHRDGHQAE